MNPIPDVRVDALCFLRAKHMEYIFPAEPCLRVFGSDRELTGRITHRAHTLTYILYTHIHVWNRYFRDNVYGNASTSNVTEYILRH